MEPKSNGPVRRVEYFNQRWVKTTYGEGGKAVKPGRFVKEKVGEAWFHQWGIDYEEFDTGPGNFSVAIIELDDGTIKNIPAEQVKFLEPIVKEDGDAKD